MCCRIKRASEVVRGERLDGPKFTSAGLVDRLRLMVFPLTCGGAGGERGCFETGGVDLETRADDDP